MGGIEGPAGGNQQPRACHVVGHPNKTKVQGCLVPRHYEIGLSLIDIEGASMYDCCITRVFFDVNTGRFSGAQRRVMSDSSVGM